MGPGAVWSAKVNFPVFSTGTPLRDSFYPRWHGGGMPPVKKQELKGDYSDIHQTCTLKDQLFEIYNFVD